MENKQKIYTLSYYNKPRPKLVDDFYEWYNYKWLNDNKIPNDEIRYSHFVQVQNEINNKLKNILESGIFPLGTSLYNSFLNSEYRNTNCINELRDLLKIMDNVITYDDLIQMATRLLFININTLFNISIEPNIYSNNNNIMYLGQPTLGLSDKSHYHDIKYKKVRQEYYNMICKMYSELYPLYDLQKINEIAKIIIDIETKLSIILLSPTDKRDMISTYHEISLDDAIKTYPDIKIDIIIQIMCLLSNNIINKQNFKKIIMEHHKDPTINYFKQLELLIPFYSVEQWKEYFKYNIILSHINLTSDNMRTLFYEMFNKIIGGQKTQKILWKSAISHTCDMLNDPISRIYTQSNINQDIEIYMKEMVDNIKRATKYRISKLEWMTDKNVERF